MDKLITLEAEIVADAKLIVEGAAEVKIDASESITLEIAPDTYVLGSIGSFNTASSWVGEYVNELVRESIGTGWTLKDALDLLRTDVMDQIEIGVNQVITEVENTYVSSSTLTTTLGSAIAGVNSTILDVQNTYATKDEAQTYAVDAIKASFGGDADSSAIEAYIGNIAVTKVDADSATAATVTTLIASMNDQTVRIDEMDSVEITPEGWQIASSKLAVDPNGNIVGWQFSNGSNELSEFTISADKFKVASGTSSAVPFSIDTTTGLTEFNGVVNFTNSDMSAYSNSNIVLPTYTEGTVNPTSTTEPIQSVYLNTTDSSLWTYTNSGWVPGGDPDAITQSTLNTALANNTTVIDGGKITTGTIDASLVNVTNLNAGSIKAGVIYNTGGSASNYTMKVDLDNGEIHIK